jgi:cell division protein FtsW
MTTSTRFMDWFCFGKAASEVLPVRLGGQSLTIPATSPRLAGFDQALGLGHGSLADVGLGDGVFSVVAMPDNPKFARYIPTS